MMLTPENFQDYFEQRAALADELFKRDFRTDAFLITTVAIDSIGAAWRHDFGEPFETGPLSFASFLDAAAGDSATSLICAVFLAEDMLAHGPARLHPVAQRMLQKRAADPSTKVTEFEFRESPHAHKDATWADLVSEEPALAGEPKLKELARQYTRAALVYRLYRCGPGHAYSRGSRTSGFADPRDDDEISYFPSYVVDGKAKAIGLHIGLHTLTRWLRAAVKGYADRCRVEQKTPAVDFDASADSLTNLKSKWVDKNGQSRI